MIKKINATKSFNAGAIIATAKKQLLVQKHVIQRIDHWSTRFFYTAHLFYPVPKILCFTVLSNRPVDM